MGRRCGERSQENNGSWVERKVNMTAKCGKRGDYEGREKGKGQTATESSEWRSESDNITKKATGSWLFAGGNGSLPVWRRRTWKGLML